LDFSRGSQGDSRRKGDGHLNGLSTAGFKPELGSAGGGWFLLAGAGPISFDALIRRGLSVAALPFTQQFSSLFDWLKAWAAPAYILSVHYWIGAIFFASDLTKIADLQSTFFLLKHEYKTPFLPVWFAAGSATVFELARPVLLIGGLFTRLAALPLIVITAVTQFTYLDHVDHLYWILLLGPHFDLGPGHFSLDALAGSWLRARLPLLFY